MVNEDLATIGKVVLVPHRQLNGVPEISLESSEQYSFSLGIGKGIGEGEGIGEGVGVLRLSYASYSFRIRFVCVPHVSHYSSKYALLSYSFLVSIVVRFLTKAPPDSLVMLSLSYDLVYTP